MARQRRRLRYSRTLALLVSALTSLGSVLGLIVTASMSPGIPTTALVNIFSVFLSLGIVAIVYDTFLRGSVLSDTLEMVGIKESVTNVGLCNIQQDMPPNWQELCSEAQRISILLVNPLGWVQSEWTHVLDAAKSKSINVSIYIPRNEGAHLELLASRLGFNQTEFVSQLNIAKKLLETSWRTEGSQSIKKGSQFTLRSYQGIAGYEVGLFDDKAIVTVTNLLDRRIPARSLVLEFSGTSARSLNQWLSGQLARLDSEPTTEFSGEVG
jgi:hypothetical protein